MESLHIGEDEVERIFQEGYSGKQATITEQQGEGIGLYRAKRLIEMNNGTLEVDTGTEISLIDSIEYSKNTFVVSLPIKFI